MGNFGAVASGEISPCCWPILTAPSPNNQNANPYYFANACVMANVARNLEKFGLPREPMDFIFDDQVMEKDRIYAGWKW